MSDATPTRSALLEMKDERRAMHDGYVFLDEKCLLLAAEILRELQHYAALRHDFDATCSAATDALEAAVARHGLHGLQVYPATSLGGAELRDTRRAVMGVRLQEVGLEVGTLTALSALDPSPEAEACRRAFAALLAAAAPLAAVSGNLERLSLEYQRSARRARALQDVLLPELDRSVSDIDSRMQELEQEDAISMRRQVKS
ncbi:MAG TPA: V-type ATP synthase subunit D [Casimicrobiaceae bacterium]|nr:V-type ATP synthase subunit D [Casimicrobiaceae bacterium]